MLESSSKKFLVIGLSILAVALIGAGGVWGYFQYYAKSPEIQVLESLAQFDSTKSISYDANILLSGESNPEKLLSSALGSESSSTAKMYTLNLGLFGGSDLTDEKSPATSLDFSLSLKRNEEIQPELKFQLIDKENIFYFRLPTLPQLASANDYSEFANKWIEFDYSKISEQFGSVIEELKKKVTSTVPSEQESKVVIDSIKKLTFLNPPLRVTKTFPDELINGVSVRHYGYILNTQNIQLIMQELVKNESITGIHQKDSDDLNKILENIDNFNGEIWFGKEDLHAYKNFISFDIKDQEEFQKGKFAMTVNLKNFNAPLNIQKPSESLSFDEVINKFMEIQMQKAMEKEMEKLNAQENAFILTSSSTEFGMPRTNEFGIKPLSTANNDWEIDSDKDGLSDKEETLIWKTNPNNPDTDADGYLDGAETKSGYDPLQKGKKLVTL
jgi:hypothetical protein